MSRYAVGSQPCQNLKRQIEANAWGMWDNVHECIYCINGGTVSWCENCRRDHHSGGYETCEMNQTRAHAAVLEEMKQHEG